MFVALATNATAADNRLAEHRQLIAERLQLSPEQQTAIETKVADLRGELRALAEDRSPGNLRKAMSKIRTFRYEVESLLGPAQLEAVQQLVAEVRQKVEDWFAEKLELTTEQRSSLKAWVETNRPRLLSLRDEFLAAERPRQRLAVMRKATSLQSEALAMLDTTLTDPQLEKLSVLRSEFRNRLKALAE